MAMGPCAGRYPCHRLPHFVYTAFFKLEISKQPMQWISEEKIKSQPKNKPTVFINIIYYRNFFMDRSKLETNFFHNYISFAIDARSEKTSYHGQSSEGNNFAQSCSLFELGSIGHHNVPFGITLIFVWGPRILTANRRKLEPVRDLIDCVQVFVEFFASNQISKETGQAPQKIEKKM